MVPPLATSIRCSGTPPARASTVTAIRSRPWPTSVAEVRMRNRPSVSSSRPTEAPPPNGHRVESGPAGQGVDGALPGKCGLEGGRSANGAGRRPVGGDAAATHPKRLPAIRPGKGLEDDVGDPAADGAGIGTHVERDVSVEAPQPPVGAP